MFNTKYKKLLFASSLIVATTAANAGYEIKLNDNDKITFGGYIKLDARYVSGDIAYSDFWAGSALFKPTSTGEKKSQFRLNAHESRFNTKYVSGDLTGFFEMDFLLSEAGNEIISNSSNPRIRHAFVKYKNLTVGQTWTTFMNTSAIAETADFAGPAMGLAFIRQGLIRYTTGNFQVAIENPYTFGGDGTIDDVPDVIAKYSFKGDWGNVSIAGLARQLHTTSGVTKSGLGYSIAGRIKSVGKDDLRFQVHGGNVGRYVGVASATDVIGDKTEDTTAYYLAYRHFWQDSLRSTFAYASAKADLSGWESKQWSINLFTNLTKKFAIGGEIGNVSRDDLNIDSNYTQLSFIYTL